MWFSWELVLGGLVLFAIALAAVLGLSDRRKPEARGFPVELKKSGPR